ncbi:MAG: hypothetical protein ACFB0G_16675 [Leptolyngbyaceae cyanobacterium]
MPYFRFPKQRQYKYELARGQFSPQDLDLDSHDVLDVLTELGVTSVYCRYNGGHDEGFAYLSGVKLKDEIIEFDDLKHQLAEGSLGIKKSKNLNRYYSYIGSPSKEQCVEFYLDGFARFLATRLLGQGYGTGEYSMKGAFKANLKTGQITDEQEQ